MVYVDDIVITGNNLHEIETFKTFLSSKCMIKDLGILKYFLGIEVWKIKMVLYITKEVCLEMLCEYGLLPCKPDATPLQQNVVLNHIEIETNKLLPSMTKYYG